MTFTAEELFATLQGDTEDESYAKVLYVRDDQTEVYDWETVKEKDVTDQRWLGKKDENGFSIVARVDVFTPGDEGYDKYGAHESRSEFFYEAGYVHPFGQFKMIDYGNLGDGHEAWALVEHHESGRLFRIGGWYSSWDSGEWNEMSEVKPAEVKVIRYQDIENGQVFDNPAVTV